MSDSEDALVWGGETDPSHVDGPATRSADAAGQSVVDRDDKPQIPGVLLVIYGILGGVYLIYTLGWVITVTRLTGVRAASSELLSEIMFQLGEFLAIASPALWFVAVFALTRNRRPVVRLLWVLLGLVVVIPWPFVLGVWG